MIGTLVDFGMRMFERIPHVIEFFIFTTGIIESSDV